LIVANDGVAANPLDGELRASRGPSAQWPLSAGGRLPDLSGSGQFEGNLRAHATVELNLRAVPLLLGHSKLEPTVRYLGMEVDDALEISEQTKSESDAGRRYSDCWTASRGKLQRASARSL